MRTRIEPLREVAMLRGLQEQAAAAAAGQAARETAAARRQLGRSGARLDGMRDAWQAALDESGDFDAGRRWSAAWHRQAGEHAACRERLDAASVAEDARRGDWARAIALQDMAAAAHKAAEAARMAARDEAAMQEASERHLTQRRIGR